MKSILAKCEHADLEFISKVLDSYLSFTNDSGRKELLSLSPSSEPAKTELISLIDKQIRYYGSSDAAYFKRAVVGEGDGGVSASEIVEDVCKKLQIPIKHGGSIEARLERLVNSVVEKELLSKTPEELGEAFQKIGVGNADSKLILEHIRSNTRAAILPILVEVLGPKTAIAIIESIVVSLVAQFVGREAAKQLFRELAKRNPWLNALGPILWVLSGAWLGLTPGAVSKL